MARYRIVVTRLPALDRPPPKLLDGLGTVEQILSPQRIAELGRLHTFDAKCGEPHWWAARERQPLNCALEIGWNAFHELRLLRFRWLDKHHIPRTRAEEIWPRVRARPLPWRDDPQIAVRGAIRATTTTTTTLDEGESL